MDKCVFYVFMCGIVIIRIYSCNKWLYVLVTTLSLTYCLSVQRLVNPKMSIVYHSASISVNIYVMLYPRQP